MCSLVSAEPSARGCGVCGEPPVRRDAQRLLLQALAAALQDLGLAAVDEGGQTPLEGDIEAGAAHGVTAFAASLGGANP